MQPRYIAFLVFIWIVGALLGAIMEEGIVGATQQTTLDKVLVWERVASDQAGWGIYTFAKATPEFLDGMFEMLTFQFSFLEDMWWFRWLILAPLIALFAWALILTFISIMSKGL